MSMSEKKCFKYLYKQFNDDDFTASVFKSSLNIINKKNKNKTSSYDNFIYFRFLRKKTTDFYQCEEIIAAIYYEYSKRKYEKPNKKQWLHLCLNFNYQDSNCLLHSFHLDYNKNNINFFRMIKDVILMVFGYNDKIVQKYGTGSCWFYIHFNNGSYLDDDVVALCDIANFDEPDIETESESDIETESESDSNNSEPEPEETDEERESRYIREHQESLNTVEETNNESGFEFDEAAFEYFWENNTASFVNGTFDITYGFLGIEEMKLRKENQGEVNHNEIKTFKSEQCIICNEEKPTILFCNCGHQCMCIKCFKLYKKNQCPMCKTDNVTIREI